MNHKSVFQKKVSLEFQSFLAHVILCSGFDLNIDRSANIRIQCGVRLGVLCIVVCNFFLQIYFSSFTYCKFSDSIVCEKFSEAKSAETIIISKFHIFIGRKII